MDSQDSIKKRGKRKGCKNLPSKNVYDNESSDSMEEAEIIRGVFSKMIHDIKKCIIDQISRLEGHFNRAIMMIIIIIMMDMRLTVEDLQKEKQILQKRCHELKTKRKILRKSNLCSLNS